MRLLLLGHVCRSVQLGKLKGVLAGQINITFLGPYDIVLTQDGFAIKKISDELDLCVLEKDNHGIPPVELSDDWPFLRTGDEVTVLGSPMGVFLTTTKGHVTSKTGAGMLDYDPPERTAGMLVLSAACYGGNSGGPVFYKGKVVGVLVMGMVSYHHIHFATDVISLKQFLNE